MDSKPLDPLNADYDSNMEDLHARGAERQLRSQIDRLVAENTRLTKELRLNVEGQMAQAGAGGSGEGGADMIQNLQRQLTDALREKEAALDLYRTTAQDLALTDQRLAALERDAGAHTLAQHTRALSDQYAGAVGDMDARTTQLHDELKRTRADLRVANIQVSELRSTLEELRNEMMLGQKLRSVKDINNMDGELRARELMQKVSDLQSQLAASQSQMSRAEQERAGVEHRLAEAQRRGAQEEARDLQQSLRMRDSVQLLETSVQERDQALVREKQLQDEVSRLQGAISKLIDDAGARTRQEVENVKKQCNVNISKLMEEMQRLELTNAVLLCEQEVGEKEAGLEQALRERRAVESELERQHRDGRTDGKTDRRADGRRDSGEYDDVTSRACAAERARDEALLRVETLSNQIRRDDIMRKQESRRVELALDAARERQAQTDAELQSVAEERVALSKGHEEVKASLHRLRQEKETGTREHSKQLWNLQQTLQLKEREYEAKLQSMEDSHRQYSLQMRDMLAAQQKMTAKWKDECNLITQKLEAKLNDSRAESSREKRRTDELTKLLRDSRQKTTEVEGRMAQCTRNMHALEARISDAEHKSGAFAEQAMRNTKTTRGLGLIDARREQQREIELNLRDSTRTLNGPDELS